MAVVTGVAPALVVGHDEDDVGFGLCGGELAAKSAKERQEEHSSHGGFGEGSVLSCGQILAEDSDVLDESLAADHADRRVFGTVIPQPAALDPAPARVLRGQHGFHLGDHLGTDLERLLLPRRGELLGRHVLEPLVVAADGIRAVRHFEGVVCRQVRIVVGELVIRGEIERLVGAQFVEAGEASGRQARAAQVVERTGDRFEVLPVAGFAVELEQRLQRALGLAPRDGGRLELSRPGGLHVEVVLLRPGRLRFGHLGEQQELARLLRGGAATHGEVGEVVARGWPAINAPGFEHRFDGGGQRVVIERVPLVVFLAARPGARPRFRIGVLHHDLFAEELDRAAQTDRGLLAQRRVHRRCRAVSAHAKRCHHRESGKRCGEQAAFHGATDVLRLEARISR